MWMVATYEQENLWRVEMIYVLMKEAIAKQNEAWDFIFFSANNMGYLTGMFFLKTQPCIWHRQRITKNDIPE